MGTDAFEYYLADRSRRGAAPAGSHSGAAGGAPCGDLVRISLAPANGRIETARFEAEGCGAAIAAGAAVVEAVEGRGILDAALVGPDEVADALGGLSPQGRHGADLAADALHRALTAAVGFGADLVPVGQRAGGPDRTLVAMSGGGDSAGAAWVERGKGAEGLAGP